MMKPIVLKDVLRVDCENSQENYKCRIENDEESKNVPNVRYITLGYDENHLTTIASMAHQYGGGISVNLGHYGESIDCGVGKKSGSDPPVNELFCGPAPLKMKALKEILK